MTKYIKMILRETENINPTDSSHDEYIDTFTPYEILDRVLQYEGIIGYTSKIISIIEEIYNIELK